jgi:hypothetical protein
MKLTATLHIKLQSWFIVQILIIVALVSSVLSAVAGIVGLWSTAADWDEPAPDASHTFVTSPPQRFNRPDVYRIGHGVTPRFSRGGKR